MIIDCDANATYAPDERIRGVIRSCLDSLGNPSSLHRGGQRARAAVEEARASLRVLIGAGVDDTVVFTSGATEANNMAIAAAGSTAGPIVSASTEHPCIVQPLKRLIRSGRSVCFVTPDSEGVVSAEKIAACITPDTALVTIMAANNETGVINPIPEISRVVRSVAPHALIHTDAAQLLGKGDVSMTSLGVDLMTLSAHKVGALSGTGALVIREGVTVPPLVLGGAQEGKLRGGTENVLGIAVFGAVADILRTELPERIERMSRVRGTFEDHLRRAIPDSIINGATVARLPNTSSVFIPGVRADDLIVAMDLERILISSGAACTSGKPEPSHVLRAMGQDDERVRSTIRISMRADLDSQVVPHIVETLTRATLRMRSIIQPEVAA